MPRKLTHALLGVDRPGEIVGLLPGIALAVAVMLVALPLSNIIGGWVVRIQGLDPLSAKSPISGVTVAILVGLVTRNLLPLPDVVKTGVRFAVAKILRLGIIFVGIKLSLLDVIKLGAWGVPVVLAAIVAGLVFITLFNRLLHLPDRLGTLIAAGTSICGVTAIVSTAPAIDADEKEVAYAVANITLFGLVGMFVYPYIAPMLLRTSEQIGLFLGTAIHDTSQVIGAALTYKELHHDEIAFKAATVTKLTRNLFLAVVVPLVSLLYHRGARGTGSTGEAVGVRKLLPMFVLGFVGMAIVRTVGDALIARSASGTLDPATWKGITTAIGETWGAKYLLGTALAGVGLGTSFSVFRGVGLKPFVVGLVGALLVGMTGLLMAALCGRFVHL